MKLIAEKIDIKLEKLINDAFISIKDLLIIKNKRINHVNIYHKEWNNNSQNGIAHDIINILKNIYNVDSSKIIRMGFICSQVNSYDQHFHIDYNGDTDTYFIPMIDLDDNNGTEYVEFINEDYNIKLFNELLTITDLYINKDQIISHFNKISIPKENYKFKFLNGNKYSMIKMEYFMFHRGQSNKSTQDRIMFQIIIARTPNPLVSSEIVIPDSELDEDPNTVEKLLISRKLNNTF